MLQRLIGLSFVAIMLIGLLIYGQWRSVPRTVSGMIEVDEIRVGSRVGGRIQQVHVVEGQRGQYRAQHRRTARDSDLTRHRAAGR